MNRDASPAITWQSQMSLALESGLAFEINMTLPNVRLG